MVDYSKFDNINSDDELDEKEEQELAKRLLKNAKDNYTNQLIAENKMPQIKPDPIVRTKKNPANGHYVFEYRGQKIYEWEQNLNDMILYIDLPHPGLGKKDFVIKFQNKHLYIGLAAANSAYIDEDTFKEINVSESLWYIEDGILIISLAKMFKADLWEFPLISQLSQVGQDGPQIIDDATKLEIKKKLMLERFQEENPGFDFSSAEFNGEIPNAREFMGGISHY